MRILVALKRSKWERDLNRYGSESETRRLYAIQNEAYERVHSSHLRQVEALALLKELFPQASYVRRSQLQTTDFSSIDCIVSLGGDNHFVFVSGFVGADLPLLGINSDPETSQGALLPFDVRELQAQVQSHGPDFGFELETWSRIQARLEYPDGSSIHMQPATSEISIRNAFPDLISRYLIRRQGEGQWEEQKSSGMLLATGAGSTGWFRNCHPPAEQDNAVFEKDANFFRLVARELRSTRRYRYRSAQIEATSVLEMVSEMDGEISIDAHPEFTYEFPPGTKAFFEHSPSPLRVVTGLSA